MRYEKDLSEGEQCKHFGKLSRKIVIDSELYAM
jgi:hypothetical protein